ncbi:MAG: ParB/RepB/Spo0J family partition protein [Rhodobacteraceae bacterium]|nr:ParB/RepB/Spo0J family partition protein [Paracoccaceae bacterium]
MSAKKLKSGGLGRGLSALMADVATDSVGLDATESRTPDMQVPIEMVFPNPGQPRRHFSEEDLAELTASIREKGVLQPLIVRPKGGNGYEIVAGERRWRAAQRGNLHKLPVLIRDYTDTEVLEVSIIENIQRVGLNAVEEATGYRQLMDRFGHTQEQLAEALGKSRSHIANLLRLLTLPDDILQLLRDGVLTAGHARALIKQENPSQLAREIMTKGLSVRATEALVKKATQPTRSRPRKQVVEKDSDTKALEGDLSANVGMPVSLSHKPGQEVGELVIKYKSLDELDTLCRLLGGV